MPGNLKVVYFFNSGSEANELATLMARLYSGNHDIISLRNAYHGGSASTMGLKTLLDSCSPSTDLSNKFCIGMVALFDKEEVGSNLVQGAGAPTMFQAMKKITKCLTHRFPEEVLFECTIHKSFLVSADSRWSTSKFF